MDLHKLHTFKDATRYALIMAGITILLSIGASIFFYSQYLQKTKEAAGRIFVIAENKVMIADKVDALSSEQLRLIYGEGIKQALYLTHSYDKSSFEPRTEKGFKLFARKAQKYLYQLMITEKVKSYIEQGVFFDADVHDIVFSDNKGQARLIQSIRYKNKVNRRLLEFRFTYKLLHSPTINNPYMLEITDIVKDKDEKIKDN